MTIKTKQQQGPLFKARSYSCYLALLLLVSPRVWGMDNYRASYRVQAGALTIGNITREFFYRHGVYALTVQSSSKIPLVDIEGNECSVGLWKDQQPQPLSYEYQYQHQGKQKQRQLHFDWINNLATAENAKQLPLKPGLQDKLSYQLALGKQLKTQGEQFTIEVANQHHSQPYVFTVLGQELLKTPAGEYLTTVLDMAGKHHHSRLWLAESEEFLIIKVRYRHDGGHTLTATLTELRKKIPFNSSNCVRNSNLAATFN